MHSNDQLVQQLKRSNSHQSKLLENKERTIQHLLEYLKMSLTPETIKQIHSDAVLKRVERARALEDVYRYVKEQAIPALNKHKEPCTYLTDIVEVVESEY